MAHLDVKQTYFLQLTPEEFSLIGRALAGKLKPQEQNEATELNARLQEMRLKQVTLAYERCKAVNEQLQGE